MWALFNLYRFTNTVNIELNIAIGVVVTSP